MIAHILKKDFILLWPMAALVTIIQIGLEWADYDQASPAAIELARPLMVTWYLSIAALIVAVVHTDPIPGVEQDWLIRPLKRSDLLLAKMVFVLAAVSLPMFALNAAHALALGFPPGHVLGTAAFKELYTYVFLLLPLLGLAALTRNLGELALIAAALMVAYAVSSAASAFLFGAGRCPTCATGLVWQQHLLQHVESGLGAGLILALQYGRRRTDVSRTLALIGAVALIAVQIPWAVAYELQRYTSRVPGAAAAVAVESAGAVEIAGSLAAPGRQLAARQATRALLRGDLDQAVQYVQARKRGEPLSLEVPVRVAGVAPDDLLLVDRAEARVLGDAGRTLSRITLYQEPPDFFFPNAAEAGETPGMLHQPVRLPAEAIGKSGAPNPQLQLTYWLTLMKVVEAHRLPALAGELRSASVGVCRSQLDEDDITVRCRQIGAAPFCFSATLFAADGTHNPEVRQCVPDYRPYMPAYTYMLSYFGLSLPVRDRSGAAHYAVDVSSLPQAYVVFKVYGEADHVQRMLSTDMLPQS